MWRGHPFYCPHLAKCATQGYYWILHRAVGRNAPLVEASETAALIMTDKPEQPCASVHHAHTTLHTTFAHNKFVCMHKMHARRAHGWRCAHKEAPSTHTRSRLQPWGSSVLWEGFLHTVQPQNDAGLLMYMHPAVITRQTLLLPARAFSQSNILLLVPCGEVGLMLQVASQPELHYVP